MTISAWKLNSIKNKRSLHRGLNGTPGYDYGNHFYVHQSNQELNKYNSCCVMCCKRKMTEAWPKIRESIVPFMSCRDKKKKYMA